MGRTQLEKLWIIGTGLGAFIIVLIGYFFFISPERGQTTQVQDQVSSTKVQNAVLQQRAVRLAAQNKNLATFQAALAKAQLALPPTSAMPAFLHSVQSISYSTSTTLTSLTVGAAAPQSSPAAAAPATGSASDTTTAPASAPDSPAGGGVYTLPITAELSGTPAHLSEFMRALQSVQPRAVLVSQIAEATSSGTGKAAVSATTLTLTMQAFVVPAQSGSQPSPSPSEQSASPSAGP